MIISVCVRDKYLEKSNTISLTIYEIFSIINTYEYITV